MIHQDNTPLLSLAIEAAVMAGKKIMDLYNTDYPVDYKADRSPLTIADREAHRIINQMLSETPYPVLSEEGRIIPFSERKNWSKYWLIDPLDGTKEFINRNGEFTVNIALIEDRVPVIGVIYVPVSGALYYGSVDNGSFRVTDGVTEKLPLSIDRPFTIIGSRSHFNPSDATFIEKIRNEYTDVRIINAGSSLKFCRIAEGSADIYPRMGPTMEWDTAAGDAIARYAGVKVFQYQSNNEELKYNKESLLNPFFIAVKEEFKNLL